MGPRAGRALPREPARAGAERPGQASGAGATCAGPQGRGSSRLRARLGQAAHGEGRRRGPRAGRGGAGGGRAASPRPEAGRAGSGGAGGGTGSRRHCLPARPLALSRAAEPAWELRAPSRPPHLSERRGEPGPGRATRRG